MKHRCLSGMGWRWGFWVRLRPDGWGIGLLNHRQYHPLFSERENQRFPFSGRSGHYFHFGPWCLRLLRPVKYIETQEGEA